MARMIPPFPLGASHGEETVFRAFEQTTPDEWTVLFDVGWHRSSSGEHRNRQADFVVIDPAHGVLVVEEKGGFIDVERGTWSTTPLGGTRKRLRKSPIKQAEDAGYDVKRRLEL